MFYIKDKNKYQALVIGGSAGSFPVITRILESLPAGSRRPLILCLHRLKEKREGFQEALRIKSKLPVSEPDDKSPIEHGNAYVAPANYHLLVEKPGLFALATTELVQYSRPSIDVLFESAADVYQDRLIALLVSGANRDGAYGMYKVKKAGGLCVVQDPEECGMATMPEAAIKATRIDHVLPVEKIIELLQSV
ncbi:MAG: chemotaxis protein CheB [Sphingobacteriia bacterium]